MTALQNASVTPNMDRGCGPHGEPAVVHVDQEHDYRVTFLADSFERFIRALEPTDAFDP